MLGGLSTQHMTPVTVNRHQTDKFLIRCTNPNNTPFTVIGAPGQLQPTAKVQMGSGQTGDIQDWNNAAGTNLAKLDSTGQLTISGGVVTIGSGTVAGTIGLGGFSTSSKISFRNGSGFYGVSYDISTDTMCLLTLSQGVNSTRNLVIGGSTDGAPGQPFMYFTGGQSTINGIASTTICWLGNGYSNAAPSTIPLIATCGVGTNIAGANMQIGGGISTGSGTPGNILLQVAPASGSSSTINTLSTVVTISPVTQNVLINCTAATVIPLVLKGAASQIGDLQQWQKSDNTVYYKMDKLARPVTSNTTPTIAAGVGAGTSPTISITGTDVNGVVTLTSGTLPTGAAVVATITFSAAFGATPKTVILTPANANAAALNALTMVWVDSGGLTTAAWTINAGATGLGAATGYVWYYQVLG